MIRMRAKGEERSIVAFLREAQPGQSVWVRDPEFPLIFYTGLKIMNARLQAPDNPPYWILPQSASGLFKMTEAPVPESMTLYYDPIVIRVYDSDRFDNVPEPDGRQDVKSCRLGAAIDHPDPDQNIFGRGLGVLHQHIEVAVLAEDAGIAQLILGIVAAAPSILLH